MMYLVLNGIQGIFTTVGNLLLNGIKGVLPLNGILGVSSPEWYTGCIYP